MDQRGNVFEESYKIFTLKISAKHLLNDTSLIYVWLCYTVKPLFQIWEKLVLNIEVNTRLAAPDRTCSFFQCLPKPQSFCYPSCFWSLNLTTSRQGNTNRTLKCHSHELCQENIASEHNPTCYDLFNLFLWWIFAILFILSKERGQDLANVQRQFWTCQVRRIYKIFLKLRCCFLFCFSTQSGSVLFCCVCSVVDGPGFTWPIPIHQKMPGLDTIPILWISSGQSCLLVFTLVWWNLVLATPSFVIVCSSKLQTST